jgi:ParB-like chromosome segregation protein Spo0J
LAESIKKRGLDYPLQVTLDNYIVAGHRRRAALEHIGRVWARCQVLPLSRDSMPTDEYIALLREHNRYRDKSVTEQINEELVEGV